MRVCSICFSTVTCDFTMSGVMGEPTRGVCDSDLTCSNSDWSFILSSNDLASSLPVLGEVGIVDFVITTLSFFFLIENIYVYLSVVPSFGVICQRDCRRE